MADRGPNPSEGTLEQDASSPTHTMSGFNPTTLTEVSISQQVSNKQVDAMFHHNSDYINMLEATTRDIPDLSH